MKTSSSLAWATLCAAPLLCMQAQAGAGPAFSSVRLTVQQMDTVTAGGVRIVKAIGKDWLAADLIEDMKKLKIKVVGLTCPA